MNGMRDYTFTLQAGQELSRNVEGTFFHVVKASGDIKIRFDEGVQISRSEGMGGSTPKYSRVEIESPIAQTVTISLGEGVVTDARATVNATVNTTIEPADTVSNPGDVTATAARVLAIAADPNRKEVEFCLPSTAQNPVRIGNAAVTANSGSILEPGCSKVFGCDAALYVIRTDAPDETVTVFSLEKP